MVKERPTIRVPYVLPWNQPGARLAASYWLFLRVKAKLTKSPPPPMTVPPGGGTIPPMMRTFFKAPDAPNPLLAEFCGWCVPTLVAINACASRAGSRPERLGVARVQSTNRVSCR